MTGKVGHWLDHFGVLASWVCAVHCLFMPFLVGIVPLLGLSFILSETTERFLIGVSLIIALLSLLPAYFRRHGKMRSIFLATAGLSLIILTHLLFEDNLLAKAFFLLTGAALISSAHLLNRYLCRTCKVC